MRNAFLAVVAALALLFTVVHSEAQKADGTQAVWSGGGRTNGFGNITNGVVIPAGNGTPVIHYISTTTDLAGGVVSVYTNDGPRAVTFSSSTTNIYCATNGFAYGKRVIIRYADGSYDFRHVQLLPSSTNVTVQLPFTQTVDTSTTIYPCDIAYTFNVGLPLGATNATVNVNNGVIVGQKNQPLAVQVNYTSNGGINTAAATYK